MPIEKWTSAFLIFMSLMLEKYHARAQEFIKYMRGISMAAEWSSKNATTSYIKKKILLSKKDILPVIKKMKNYAGKKINLCKIRSNIRI